MKRLLLSVSLVLLALWVTPVSALSPSAGPDACMLPAAVDDAVCSMADPLEEALPWEEAPAPAMQIYVCGNIYCPEVEVCWWKCMAVMGCDGILDYLNPACLIAAGGCCVGCGGPFGNSCYP